MRVTFTAKEICEETEEDICFKVLQIFFSFFKCVEHVADQCEGQ